MSESSKLVQKEYRSKRDWVRKLIHYKLCNRLEFGHAYKWYMHKPESIQENEML